MVQIASARERASTGLSCRTFSPETPENGHFLTFWVTKASRTLDKER